MEVVLLKNHEHLGEKGAVVTVADGYARNFMFPSQTAKEVDPAMKIHLTVIDKQRQKKVARERDEKKADVAKLESGVYAIKVKAAENGKLFGTVTHAQIAEVVKAVSGLAVDKRKVHVDVGIKKLGEYPVTIKYYPGLEAKVKIKLEREQAEK